MTPVDLTVQFYNKKSKSIIYDKKVFLLNIKFTFLSKIYLIIIILFKKIKINAFVALVAFFWSEKGVGWIIPFHIPLNLRILKELFIKAMNSVGPKINKKTIHPKITPSNKNNISEN